MTIDPIADNKQATVYITRLAQLLAPICGLVLTWEMKGGLNHDFDHGTLTAENSSKATTTLSNLAHDLGTP
jgi:hypothetical protein